MEAARDQASLLAALRKAPRRRLLLDYDGTLVPIVSRPELAAPDAELLDLLRLLAAQPGTEVRVVSGRPREVLDQWLGPLPIALHAEHGLWSRERTDGRWRLLPGVNTAFLPPVQAVMEQHVARAPGAFIERKTASLAWHYRAVEEAVGLQVATSLTRTLAAMSEAAVFDILPGHKVIEVRPRGVHKGRAVPASDGAATVAFGDDQTDEDMFTALPPGAVAVRVGPGPTRATVRIATPADLRTWLWDLVAPVDRHAAPPRPQV